MSGPKCSEYYVDRNAELIRRAQQAAWGEARAAEDTLRDLLTSADDSSRKVGAEAFSVRPANDTSLAEIESYIVRLQRCIAKVDTQIRQKKIANRFAQFSSSIDIADLPARRAPLAKPKSARRQSIPKSTKADRKELVDRVLSRLHAHATAEQQDDLLGLAKMIVDEPNRARRFESELRLRVQTLNQAIEESQKGREKAQALLAGLRGLEGHDVESLANELQSIVDGADLLDSELASRTEGVVARAKREADEKYVADMLREELESLGYQVDEGFSTMVVRGGKAEFIRRGDSEYGISVGIDSDEGRINFGVVREGDPSARLSVEQREKDIAADRAYCDDCKTIVSALESRGIRNSLVRQPSLGHTSVRVVREVDRHGRSKSRKRVELTAKIRERG